MFSKTEQEIMRKWEGSINKPLVSISCITYNHEKFINKSLDSMLMQETEFPFEILIHDDASLDKTANIIREYEKKYPNIIKPIYQTENQYSKKEGSVSARFNYPRAKGKYIALIEGDDYWIHPHKLKKQVDFLEKNKNYSMCYHGFKREMNGKLIDSHPKTKDTITFDDYLKEQTHVQTCTVLFKNTIKSLIPLNVIRKVTGTFFIFLRLSEIGHLKYMDDVMAVYRIHDSGIWSGEGKADQINMALKNVYAMYLHYKNNDKASKILLTSYRCRSIYYFNYYLVKFDLKNMKRFGSMALNTGFSLKFITCFFDYYIQYFKNKLKNISNKIRKD